MENMQNTDRKLVLSASQEYYDKFIELVKVTGSDEDALNYMIDKAYSVLFIETNLKSITQQNDGKPVMKSIRKSQGERYRADNPERVHPEDMENRELLEVYSGYAKIPFYTPEESDYVGQLRLEMLKRMDNSSNCLNVR